MYASETIQNCKNPTGHIDTLTSKQKMLEESYHTHEREIGFTMGYEAEIAKYCFYASIIIDSY